MHYLRRIITALVDRIAPLMESDTSRLDRWDGRS
jgi:hypothetical protein